MFAKGNERTFVPTHSRRVEDEKRAGRAHPLTYMTPAIAARVDGRRKAFVVSNRPQSIEEIQMSTKIMEL